MNKRKSKVVILMATYNGEEYLKAQVDSILEQSFSDFVLIIRDDNSNDSTMKILTRYDDERVIILRNNSLVHGQLENFSALFSYARENINFKYLMFSDQDDIWYKDKIKNSIYVLEDSVYKNRPLLVYTNYYVKNMLTGKKSLAYEKKISEEFSKLFVQNWIMGCTMILNKKMVDSISIIPRNVENHDYWIALNASLMGSILYYNKPTMVHRLHSKNVTTRAKTATLTGRIMTVISTLKNRKKKYKIWDTLLILLNKNYKNNSNIKNLNLLLNSKRYKRIKNARKYGFRGITFKATIMFYILLFLY